MGTILSLNTGSMTVKYRLFAADSLAPRAWGRAERIGESDAVVWHGTSSGGTDRDPVRAVLPSHESAVRRLLEDLVGAGAVQGLAGVGHRVVHGGDRFSVPARIDEAVLAEIRALGRLAPLHNPINAAGIEVARGLLPDVPHVAVFDTAFHRSLPERAWRYAIPGEYADRGFRRYGFHGISHAGAAAAAAGVLGRPLAALSLITLHLGGGCSATAVRAGESVDTSMGMTPLEGLVMGTRSGDLDPAVVLRLLGSEGLAPQAVDDLLNHRSGLRALAGTADMRDIQARADAGDGDAERALDLFCYRIRKYIGAYAAALGHVDAIAFTGGIGENAAGVRARICADLGAFGVRLDEERNRAGETAIQADGAAVAVLVIPSDEEREIARATAALVCHEDDPQ